MFDLYARVFCSISRTQSCKCTVLKLKEVSRPCGFSLGKVHTEQIHCTVSVVFLFKNTRWMGFTINSCIAHLCSISRFFLRPVAFLNPKTHSVWMAALSAHRHFTDYSYIYTFSRHSYPKQLKKVNKRNCIATACTNRETRCWDLLTWSKNKLYSNILVTNETTFAMV